MIWTMKPSRARVLTVIAATVISIACGTNYVYSAWAPQFAQRLKLSATESNLIGTFGNLGMYISGIPFGMLIDAKGPRWGVASGVVLFAAGYYPLAKAFDAGPGVFHVATLCFFSFFTGAGSCSAFSASIKAAALNYPDARGTATAFPLAAYGLSAFVFATVALALPHDTPHFLLLLATGTVGLPILAFPFLRVIPTHDYASVPQHRNTALRRPSSSASHQRLGQPDSGAKPFVPEHPPSPSSRQDPYENGDDGENSSLLSTTSSEAMADMEASKSIEADKEATSPHADIRGFALLRHIEFYQLFSMLGLLCGIGLMTINNIGNDVQALWKYYDPSVSEAFIAKRQATYVSVISVCSFSGRLISGIGSDVLVNSYNRSRFWCLLGSSVLFAVGQLLAVFVQHPDSLIFVCGTTGIAYGMLFGVYPSLVAHAFGVHGMSQNWGTIILAPVITGNIFNLLYGVIYDSNSIIDDDGNRECLEGNGCYSKAYLATWTASLVGIVLCGWSIYHENRVHHLVQNFIAPFSRISLANGGYIGRG